MQTHEGLNLRRVQQTDIRAIVGFRSHQYARKFLGKDEARSLYLNLYRTWYLRRLRDGTVLGCIVEQHEAGPVAIGSMLLRAAHPLPGFKGERAGYIFGVFTLPSFRGMGLASQIVTELVEVARAKRIGRISLHAERARATFYRRLGFRKTGEVGRVP